jgi:hypothetical protein
MASISQGKSLIKLSLAQLMQISAQIHHKLSQYWCNCAKKFYKISLGTIHIKKRKNTTTMIATTVTAGITLEKLYH